MKRIQNFVFSFKIWSPNPFFSTLGSKLVMMPFFAKVYDPSTESKLKIFSLSSKNLNFLRHFSVSISNFLWTDKFLSFRDAKVLENSLKMIYNSLSNLNFVICAILIGYLFYLTKDDTLFRIYPALFSLFLTLDFEFTTTVNLPPKFCLKGDVWLLIIGSNVLLPTELFIFIGF